MSTRRLFTLTIIIAQTLTISLITMFVTVSPVSALASDCFVQLTKSLRYTNIDGKSSVTINSNDNLVLDNITSSVRAAISVFTQRCSGGEIQTDMWWDYLDGYDDRWVLINDTGWGSTTNTTFNISPANITKWSAGFAAAYCDSTRCQQTSDEWINFWYMHQNSNTVTSTGVLSAKFTMPWYIDTLGPPVPNTSPQLSYLPTYYVLIGTDPAVKSNRNSSNIPTGSTETQIPAGYVSLSDAHAADQNDHYWRISMNIDNFQIPDLTPGTTYYWRLKQVGSNTVGYMPGGSFTITAPTPFTISGNVFLDNNENKVMDQQESCYTSQVTIAVYPVGGTIDSFNFPTGCNYTIPKQYSDPPTAILFLANIPSGYFVTINPTNIGASNSTNANIGLKQITTVTGAHKRVFLTSQVYQGNLGGLAGADAKCQERAKSKNLGGTWKAWLSDDNTSASSRLNHDNIPYALLNGQQIADNWNGLTDGNLDTPINVDENGNKVTFQTLVWSGTDSNGNTSPQSGFKCNNWTSADDIYGHNGSSTNANYYWTSSGHGRCWQQARLYCFDQGPPSTQVPPASPFPSPPPAQPPPPPSSTVTSSSCGSGTARATGLVSTPQFQSGSKFSTTEACIIDPKAAFVPFKIPTYDDLKSIYFDQSKAAKVPVSKDLANQGDLTSAAKGANVIFVSKDLEINGNMLQNIDKPILVFVKEKLSIKKDISFAENSQVGGLVFVVGGDVDIDTGVTKVNAVIISQGKIYTAGANCTSTSPVTVNQLVVNGSLISLDPEKKIEFCRTLSGGQNAFTPAEKINHQIKYLIILRNFLSDTYQKWSEIP